MTRAISVAVFLFFLVMLLHCAVYDAKNASSNTKVSSEGGMFLSGFSRGNLINTRGHKLTTMTSPPIVLITHYRMTSYLSLVLPTGYELV